MEGSGLNPGIIGFRNPIASVAALASTLRRVAKRMIEIVGQEPKMLRGVGRRDVAVRL